MPEFEVKIVRKEWIENWYEYADTTKEPSVETKEISRNGSLGIVEIVSANTKAEAERLVLNKNPGFVAISSDTQRLR